jgi:ribose transport system permease protein
MVAVDIPDQSRPSGTWRSKLTGATGPLIGLLLLCLFLSVSTDAFLSVRNGLNILDQITVLGIMAVGMTFVILIGGIDLSVGSVLALSMMVTGWAANTAGLPLGIGIALGLLPSAA